MLPKDEKVEGNAIIKLPVIEDNDDVHYVLPLKSFPKLENHEEVKVENLSGDDIFEEKDVNVTHLDQYNVKDPNAAKVLSTDSGCEKVVGHVPWELARYLSPIIEKDCLIIEVVCQRMTRIDVIESNNHGGSDSCREDVLHVVECAKNFIPGKRKYQQNFRLLIQEVMRRSFKSLSDRGRDIFVRLFTLKGPLFRVANISYQEVTDPQQAIEGLCCKSEHDGFMQFAWNYILCSLNFSSLAARCYGCSFESLKEPDGKQKLISLFFGSYEDGKCPSGPSLPSTVEPKLNLPQAVQVETTKRENLNRLE
ncbi:hypothetical protein C5167_025172 [Papaver somniferum]|uniref:Fanconi-associated nuclease n=1 Tax=Papaver somniferum TaxID=3469 RepID=A0A4Y7JRS3_PAPSO|nr:hypothetical protein C5167_025172 [Papaver somniferum]